MINEQPLVSVIIIFLNTEKFISEAIESVFAQNYQNWELFLVDDGSTDNSTVIALEYAQKYPQKVRYLDHENHQNRGTSVSRNLGIEHSQGKYIAFLDADDIWLSHKLEQQVKILQSYPEAAMVYGRMQYWYSWTGNPEDSQRDYFEELGFPSNTLIEPPKLLINLIQQKYQQFGTPNVMIRRAILEKVGRFEESFRVWGEDHIFFIKVALNAPIFVSGECWMKYRRHENSCTYSISQNKKQFVRQQQKQFTKYIDWLNWVENYFLNQGMNNVEVWKVLRKMKLLYRYPTIYFFWRGYLESLIPIGRRILPVKLRHWLWINIVSKLYGIKIKT